MKKPLLLLISLSLTACFACSRSQAGLAQYVGTWQTTYTIMNAKGIRVTTGSLNVKQPASDTINFANSSSVVTGVDSFGIPTTQTSSFDVTLKQTSNNYLLSLRVDGQGVLNDYVLNADSEGLSGQSQVSLDGKQRPVTASIKKKGPGSVWKIAAEDDGGPKHLYEFEFQEKK